MWRLMQQQNDQNDETFPRMMLYPQLSRVHNAGVKGGVTVDNAQSSGGSHLSSWLISGACSANSQSISFVTDQLLS